jgi:hypothetical protein
MLVIVLQNGAQPFMLHRSYGLDNKSIVPGEIEEAAGFSGGAQFGQYIPDENHEYQEEA